MKSRLRDIKPLFYLYQIYKYLVLFPLIGASTIFAGCIASLTSILFNEKAAAALGVFWGKFNASITPAWVKVINGEFIDRNQSYIIISNHRSLFDILVVYGWLPVDFRWVMKIELRKVPFLGYACYKLGHVFINRKDRASALSSINEAKKKITGGTSILFFPEGTRSDDGKLLDFKRGAFHLALDLGLPILPVSIIGTGDIVPNKTIAVFPGRASLVLQRPIKIDGYNHGNIDLLIAEGKKAIQKGLDEYSS